MAELKSLKREQTGVKSSFVLLPPAAPVSSSERAHIHVTWIALPADRACALRSVQPASLGTKGSPTDHRSLRTIGLKGLRERNRIDRIVEGALMLEATVGSRQHREVELEYRDIGKVSD